MYASLILASTHPERRFWTQFEAWLSMMKPSSEGLISTRASERRCHITCLHNAKETSEEVTKMVLQVASPVSRAFQKELALSDTSLAADILPTTR